MKGDVEPQGDFALANRHSQHITIAKQGYPEHKKPSLGKFRARVSLVCSVDGGLLARIRRTAVMDNLNTHKVASLYEAFPAGQAHDLARKLEFHYTPKHGSWLNIAEIELAVLSNMCLSQRTPDKDALRSEVEANVKERNLKATPVNWRFTTQDARRKLSRLYPCVLK